MRRWWVDTAPSSVSGALVVMPEVAVVVSSWECDLSC
jgi:hypothetical protein